MANRVHLSQCQRSQQPPRWLRSRQRLAQHGDEPTGVVRDVNNLITEVTRLTALLENERTRASFGNQQVRTPEAQPETSTTEEHQRRFDNWLSWAIALVGVILPGLAIVLPRILQTGRLGWADIGIPLGQGVFLFPIAMLSIEALRRGVQITGTTWMIITLRNTLLAMGALTAILTIYTATVVAMQSPEMRVLPRAIEMYTLLTLVLAVPIGTLGVVIANRQEKSNEQD